jgi:hypothetical protein
MTVTNWKPSATPDQARKGTFDIELPSGICILGCSLVEKDGKRFVGFPQNIWKKSDGKTLYFPTVSIPDKDRKNAFDVQALDALEKCRAGATQK